MVDYYSLLLRAVTAPGAGDAQWRSGIYDRARRMVADQMRTRRPPASAAEIAAEEAAVDAAIKRIEAEMTWTETAGDDTAAARIEPRAAPLAKLSRPGATIGVVLAVVVAALGAAGYVYWSATAQKPNPPASGVAAPATAAVTLKDGDLPPGVDGGSSDDDLSYVFRRQSTFYRTLQPVGTIIVDKLQRFLYLIRPNNVAVRYGIGIGEQCSDLAGLHHVASMAEWPSWQPPPEMIARKLAKEGILAGAPGNPLGARVIELDDGASRINGTNAPKTIGTAVKFGCIRLVNDDIVDLYGRVQVATPVIVN